MWRIFNTIQHPSLIGVDVSDASIKVLQLNREEGIHAYGKASLSKGAVMDGVITDVEAFSEALNKVLSRTKPHILREEHAVLRALIGLPESKIFTHQLTIPAEVSAANFAAYIEDEMQKTMPLPLSEMYWDYHVLHTSGLQKATFMGVRKVHLDNYIEAFSRAGAKPIFVSGALYALGNALLSPQDLLKSHMIIDIGARTSTIGIFFGDAYPSASVTVPLGGATLTETLMKKLSLPKTEAEEAKHLHGIGTGKKDNVVATLLRVILEALMAEAKRAKDFYEKKMEGTIEKVTLSGGTALMPGLSDYVAEYLKVPVSIGDPLKAIKNKEVLEEDMPGVFFANVIGLAIAARHADLSELNLLTQYRYEEGTGVKEGIALREARSYREIFYVLYSQFQKISSMLYKRCAPVLRLFGRVRIPNARIFGAALLMLAAVSFLLWVIGTYA